ncbi:hypothetical protein [Butyrivibrio sp. INlla16]|nr:hypothetical protein [Butyrivibrio sp. INlla16]
MKFINSKKVFLVSDEDCIRESIGFIEDTLKSVDLNYTNDKMFLPV